MSALPAEKTLDCSDLDQYMGKPIQEARQKEKLHNNEFRRWAQAMHYPNLLHYDEQYSKESRFRKLVAPQSFAVATDDGHGAGPACVGRIPNSHLIFGGDEWWFYGPRMKQGDRILNERIPFDYTIKETIEAGLMLKGGLTFARLYFLRPKENPLPRQVRLAPAW